MTPKVIDANATIDSLTIVYSEAFENVEAQVMTMNKGTGDTKPIPLPTQVMSPARKTVRFDLSRTPLEQNDPILVWVKTDRDPGTTLPLTVGKQPGDLRPVTSAVEDAVSYPILTEPVTYPAYPSPAGSGGGYGAGLNLSSPSAAVCKVLSGVLGWKANSDDPKGFIGALTQSFDLQDVEGHTEATWNPRSYAVQTDMGGGIAGAQASLYTRAKAAVDGAIPLLNGLYPLDPDSDPMYVKALREMAKSQMAEIVKELGTVGTPSTLRIETYFEILLGAVDNSAPGGGIVFDPDQVEGTLGDIRSRYGVYFFENPFSNSVEDEQNLTNYRIVSDYLTSLRQSWQSNKAFFQLGKPGQPAFFGTQLVLLSRQFSVIGETINQVRFALDSVFIGPSERQTLLLEFSSEDGSGSDPSIFIEDLLLEIESFVAEEAPRLLQDGGRISVTNNLLPVVRSYKRMVAHARRPANLDRLPNGYRTSRVQRALHDLHDQLRELMTLAEPVTQVIQPPIQQPELFTASLSPVHIEASDEKAHVLITGGGFVPGQTQCTFQLVPGAAAAPSRRPRQAQPSDSGNGSTMVTATVISENVLMVMPALTLPGQYGVTVSVGDRGTRFPKESRLADKLVVTSNQTS